MIEAIYHQSLNKLFSCVAAFIGSRTNYEMTAVETRVRTRYGENVFGVTNDMRQRVWSGKHQVSLERKVTENKNIGRAV